MVRRSSKKHVSWFEINRPRYSALANMVAATIRTLLQNEKIDVIDVAYRAKTIASFAEKIRRKRYSNPQLEMTDLAGVRVVTLIERDIDRVSKIIQGAFNVHADSSGDKSEDLGSDRFGYRSVHFVCDIGNARKSLPEFAPYADMPFEIQVRTALQHAWAEIEHDRSYKFSGELPSKLKRRFHLIAGLLELADREFSSLTQELESYTTAVQTQADAGNLEMELNSTTAVEFLKVAVAHHSSRLRVEINKLNQDAIAELRRFGVDTIAELGALLNTEFLSAVSGAETTSIGLIRDAMIYADIDRYFETAWVEAWHGWDEDSIRFAEQKYGRDKVKAIIGKYSLDVIPSDDFDDGFFDEDVSSPSDENAEGEEHA
jgi:putative GTP pyrophosphokinase